MGTSQSAVLMHILGMLREFGVPEHQVEHEPRLNRLLNSQELEDLSKELSQAYGIDLSTDRIDTVPRLVHAIHGD
ncbi:hypothetical protein G7009_02375 [Pseudomonas capeferrum]|uniref:hypothetical protein n=1 Tax=Pseudomonas capeferrum TaxID=1495066 RepID=UPI0015E3E873|nr:hypothetical protein [Pseudomonas capeferrum]MBA1200641.1 hypothetical protein [Pseudomonas capeferrum]